MPDLRDVLRFVAQKANAPLVRSGELRKAFSAPPKGIKEMPGYYVRHLRELFSDPKKLRLALTDITPLSLVTNTLTVPATLKMLQMYPHRRAETLAGALGNIVGGQLMQRTGITGGILGGLLGEVLGRAVARPFSGKKKSLPNPVAERLQAVRSTGQHIDDLLEAAQDKLNTKYSSDSLFGVGGADGMTQHVQNTTDPDIGGQHPELQELPGQYGARQSISNRGKTIGTGDTFLGDLVRFLGLGTIESRRPGDPVGQHVDLDPAYQTATMSAVPGGVQNPVRSKL